MKVYGTSLNLCVLSMLLTSCISTSRERELQNDIFSMKTRILELEQRLSSEKEKGSEDETSLSKRIASTNTQMDRLEVKIKKVVGDVDTLRVGVTSGRLPGTDPAEDSVASRLEQMEARLTAVEELQMEIGRNRPAPANDAQNSENSASSRSRGKLQNLKDFNDAFNARRFKHIVEDGSTAIRNANRDEKRDLQFLLAESVYKMGNIKDAALRFNELVEANPRAELKVKALLRLGDCFRHLGDQVTAKIYYTELVEKHASSEEAKTATERLAELEKS